jgi:hypothetical protein
MAEPREIRDLPARLRNNPKVRAVANALEAARRSRSKARTELAEVREEAEESRTMATVSAGAGASVGTLAAGVVDGAFGAPAIGPIPVRYGLALGTLVGGVAMDSPFVAGMASGMISPELYMAGARLGGMFAPAAPES